MKEKQLYENLANSIIVRACNDYRYNVITEQEFKDFLYSDWFAILSDVNPDVIYQRITMEKRYKKYGKKKSKK